VIVLLRLYPCSWRARYGNEVTELLRHQRWSWSLLIDLVAGAIDAHLYPMPALAEAEEPLRKRGNKQMLGKMLKLRCAGAGPIVTSRDQWRSTGVMLGVTILLTAFWLLLLNAHRDNRYVFSFHLMIFPTAYILAMPLTSLKGRSLRTKAVLVGGMLLFVAALWLLVGFILTQRL
jgi:hypothetical protein